MTLAKVFLYPVFLCFISCINNPIDNGLHIDESTFNEKQSSWDSADNDSYSFNYSHINKYLPSDNYIVAVDVKDNQVVNYTLLEFSGINEASCTENQWNEYVESFNSSIEDSNTFLIDNIFSNVKDIIEECKDNYSKYPNRYSANIDFDFLEEVPYLSKCKIVSKFTDKELDGGYTDLLIEIKDFKKSDD